MKRTRKVEQDTPLRPRAVAEGVWEEASVRLNESLPRCWLRELIAEANTVYAHNARFRRCLRANGDARRGHLWMFARHWLAALMQERLRICMRGCRARSAAVSRCRTATASSAFNLVIDPIRCSDH
jgi:hypothetical protein